MVLRYIITSKMLLILNVIFEWHWKRFSFHKVSSFQTFSLPNFFFFLLTTYYFIVSY